MAVYSYKYNYEDSTKEMEELTYTRKGGFGSIAEMVDSLVEDLRKIPGEKQVDIDIYKSGTPFHAWSLVPASEAIVLVEKLRG